MTMNLFASFLGLLLLIWYYASTRDDTYKEKKYSFNMYMTLGIIICFITPINTLPYLLFAVLWMD